MSRRLPPLVDVAVAVALAGLVLVVLGTQPPDDPVQREPDLLAVVLVLAMALPYATSRARPGLSAGVALVAALASAPLNFTGLVAGYFAVVAVVVSAVLRGERQVALAVAAASFATGLLGTVAAAVAIEPYGVEPEGVVQTLGTIAAPVALAYALRVDRERAREARRAARRLADLRVLDAREAVARERLRIARDVHDAVGHHLSAIRIQASAGATVARDDPEEAVASLAAIGALASQALGETREVVAALRDPAEPPAAAATAPLEHLDELVRALGVAGLEVRVDARGARRDLDGTVQEAAYRILQEALTNVARHAAPATVDVRLTFAADRLELEVVDDGPGARRAGAPGGHGVAGMRERAALVGGVLEAGPGGDGGGWRVWARLPARAGAA